MFRFYLDDNLVKDPINWGDFTETIERDELIKGLLPKYELKLNFTGGAYKYLYDLKRADGYCNMVRLKVQQSCGDQNFKTILNGFISISRCIFNLNKCTVECDVIDNSYGAMIYNNKSIKTSLQSDKSKNGVTIASPNIELLVPFEPSTGTYASTADARSVVSIFEAFKFLVAFMTDGTVGFESTFLSDVDNNGVITTGNNLRPNNLDYAMLSFQELFTEVDRKLNIGFTVVNRSNVPTIKIENIDFFYGNSQSIEINHIQGLLESFNPELLYSGVKLGGTIADFDPAIHTFTPKQFIGFDIEEYFFTGVCNLDKILDLSGQYIFDTNIIEELVYTNLTNRSYDKDIFIIKGTKSGGFYYADKFELRTSGGYQYNKFFTNEYTSQSHNIYGDTVLYEGLVSNGFRAERTDYDETNPTGANFPHAPTGSADVLHHDLVSPTYQSTTVSQTYNDDTNPPNNDPGGNYNNSNGRYTAPLDGSYFFEMTAKIRIFSEFEVLGTQGIPRFTRFTLTFNQYDSGNIIVDTFSTTYPDKVGTTLDDFDSRYSGVYTFKNEYYIAMKAGDYVYTSVTVESFPESTDDWLWCNITNTSFWQTEATPSGGGVYQKGDNAEYFVSKLEFDRPISIEAYETIKEDLTKYMRISHDGQEFKRGWIRRMQRNYKNGDSQIELISNLQNT